MAGRTNNTPVAIERHTFGLPLETEDYTVVHLRAGASWENHSLNLTVDNIFEEDYTLGVDTFAPSAVSLPHPRFVNLNWTMWFGD